MHRGAGFRIIAGLLTLAGLAIIGALAYGAGYSAGSVDGTGHVVGWAYGGGFFGWHLLGFIFGLFVLVMVLRLVMFAIFSGRHGRWGWYGHGMHDPAFGPDGGPAGSAQYAGQGFGPGPWRGGPRHFDRYATPQAWFDEFHRRSHDNVTPGTGSAKDPAANPGGNPGSGSGTNPGA